MRRRRPAAPWTCLVASPEQLWIVRVRFGRLWTPETVDRSLATGAVTLQTDFDHVPESRALTASATVRPSARPVACGVNRFMTRAHVAHGCGAGFGDRGLDQSFEFVVGQRRRQVIGNHLSLGHLAFGPVSSARIAVGVGRLAALLCFLGEHREDIVGELTRLGAGDLGRGHSCEHHPDRRGS